MKLLLVESPAKAKVLKKYLDKNEYDVIATYGHVRDIPSKQSSIDIENDYHITWKVKKKLKIDIEKYTEAILATDPDREGEAIAWHVQSIFQFPKISRISFNSLTEKSLKKALNNPRQLDGQLINAYKARTILDFIVGFWLSPVLWRKLPGAKSAGRVQSVALSILAERELEIKQFVPKKYYEISMMIENNIIASLSTKELITDDSIYNDIIKKQYFLSEIIKTKTKISAKAPFITSTLQQAASTELGFSPDKTMRIAQSLYEGQNKLYEGLITYMRTDSCSIDQDFLNQLRLYINKKYNSLISSEEQIYQSKVKNAQEAHEAIRAANLSYDPEFIKESVDHDQYKLYKLIWDRMISSQLKPSIYENTKYIIKSQDKKTIFITNVSNLIDRGYKFYQNETNIEYPLQLDQEINIVQWNNEIKHTLPPSRYGEASMIKTLESIGIGRPSTYARIINVLKDRDYVSLINKRLVPNNKGIIVCEFLKIYFSKYINYEFTTKMEEELDMIANGSTEYINVLNNFWNQFNQSINIMKQIKIEDILFELEKSLRGKLWNLNITCCNNNMILKTSKAYPFLHCISCNKLYSITDHEYVEDKVVFTYKNRDVIQKYGRYGKYLEWENDEKNIIRVQEMPYEQFIDIIELPRVVGQDNDKDIILKYGRFGFYLFDGEMNYSIPSKIDIKHITQEIILEILKRKTNK